MATTTPKRTSKAPKPAAGKTTATKATPAKAAKLATTAKPAAAKPVAAKPKTVPTPRVVRVAEPVVGQPDLKKRELIESVVERSGIKKKDAKPVVEAMLAILGETLSGGRELNLQPFGKLRINRTNEKGNGRVIICKLRQSTLVEKAPKDPLAKAAE